MSIGGRGTPQARASRRLVDGDHVPGSAVRIAAGKAAGWCTRSHAEA